MLPSVPPIRIIVNSICCAKIKGGKAFDSVDAACEKDTDEEVSDKDTASSVESHRNQL
tara:strand:+ start:1399 stop:1572 length:174 start_codon:yes stop_codon:yes gene_type:complete